MTFGPVEPFDLVALEDRVLAKWRDDDVIDHVRKLRQDGDPWIFYEGPPTANGQPGLHHVWARVFKDLYPRFRTMQGRYVPRKGGWDCHGLPVEIEVEKELGFTAKHQIEEYGVAEFNQRCRDSVHRYVEDWATLTQRGGIWIDTEDAYWTLTNEYIESVWWLVKRMFDDGLLYEGHRVSPYCPRCGTALSSHEMGQPGVYRDVTDPSIYVRFPLRDDDADLLVWTTTPWTLISNVAAAVGTDIDYARIRVPEGRDLIMAAAAADRFFGESEPYDVVERMTGADLLGSRYHRPYRFMQYRAGEADRAEVVVAGDHVTTDSGSGIVHIAPAFGDEDADVGRRNELPVFNPVDAEGAFDDQVTPWSGLGVKQADPQIIEDLATRGLLVRQEDYVHSYPHCWRCSTPLIYWAKTSWFARTSQRRTELMRENERIGWYPEHIKTGRFGKWLESNVDWALSRDRYWGTPLPVWRCADGHDSCVGSVAELSELAGSDLSGLDLHRPYIDDVVVSCPQCGKEARRLAPVLDAWFDSGSMPSAQQHHPFAGQATDDVPPMFPADFICEAIDQTRGWFYSLLAVNTLAFGETPYRNCVCLGHIVDGDGQKMSKSRGNVIDPWDIFTTHGADAVRWYFLAAGQPWSNRRVSEDGIRESTRQTLLTLWNVWSFFATYADLDGWQPDPTWAPAETTHPLDRWVLGELDDTIVSVTAALEDFDGFGAASRIARFVDDLSNWYVRRSRPRFWKATDQAAYATLHRCLTVAAELLAPFIPFLADDLWTSLTGGLSVHAADWPTPAGMRDEHLASQVDAVRRLVGLGRSARAERKVKVRQPLRQALLLHPGVTLDETSRRELEIELNVKVSETVEGLGGIVSWSIVPNFRTLGPRLGPKVNDVKRALEESDGAVLAAQLDTEGFIEVLGERLRADDVEVRAERHGQYALAQDGPWAVGLDLELDDELLVEGTARELSRAINDLRKDGGFEIADRVDVVLSPPAGSRVALAVERHRDWIAGEVLATSLSLGAEGGEAIDVDGEPVDITLTLA